VKRKHRLLDDEESVEPRSELLAERCAHDHRRDAALLDEELADPAVGATPQPEADLALGGSVDETALTKDPPSAGTRAGVSTATTSPRDR